VILLDATKAGLDQEEKDEERVCEESMSSHEGIMTEEI